tara:strand:- start:1277 stop:1525 length:249 start_codon:yes stop_codon:yes gene_type:complete
MIKIRNLSKKFDDLMALSNLSFDVKEGEILCLLGANGAGKSTTINILIGECNNRHHCIDNILDCRCVNRRERQLQCMRMLLQ